MAKRTDTARSIMWDSMRGYFNGDGLIHLADGSISKTEIDTTYRDRPEELVDRFYELMRISPTPATRAALRAYARSAERWERAYLSGLIMIAPEFHVA
jgi:hypothetical protein